MKKLNEEQRKNIEDLNTVLLSYADNGVKLLGEQIICFVSEFCEINGFGDLTDLIKPQNVYDLASTVSKYKFRDKLIYNVISELFVSRYEIKNLYGVFYLDSTTVQQNHKSYYLHLLEYSFKYNCERVQKTLLNHKYYSIEDRFLETKKYGILNGFSIAFILQLTKEKDNITSIMDSVVFRLNEVVGSLPVKDVDYSEDYVNKLYKSFILSNLNISKMQSSRYDRMLEDDIFNRVDAIDRIKHTIKQRLE